MSTLTVPVSSMTTTDKLGEVFNRVGPYIGTDALEVLKQFITPHALTVMAVTLAVWGVAQLFGVGEVVDVIMLALGVVALGKNAVSFVEDLVKAGITTLNAKSDDDLTLAAQYLGRAIVEGGVEVILALLMRKDLGEIKVKINNLRAMKPGLVKVSLPPSTPASKLKITFSKSLGRGASKGLVRGSTNEYGAITIAREGYEFVSDASGVTKAQWVTFTAAQKMETILHEIVHRTLSPKAGVLMQFRASVAISGYSRIYILKYLEEAMAQSYALAKTRGVTGIWSGIKFPISNGYLTIWQALAPAKAGAAVMIGHFILAGKKFIVGFEQGHPSGQEIPAYDWQTATP